MYIVNYKYILLLVRICGTLEQIYNALKKITFLKMFSAIINLLMIHNKWLNEMLKQDYDKNKEEHT